MPDLYRLRQMPGSDPGDAGRDAETGTAKAATEE